MFLLQILLKIGNDKKCLYKYYSYLRTAVYKMVRVCSQGSILFTVTHIVESVSFWLISLNEMLTLRTVSSYVQKRHV